MLPLRVLQKTKFPFSVLCGSFCTPVFFREFGGLRVFLFLIDLRFSKGFFFYYCFSLGFLLDDIFVVFLCLVCRISSFLPRV